MSDNKFKKLGYSKIEESDEIVVYEKPMADYIKVIEIGRREDEYFAINCYRRGVNCEGHYNAAELLRAEAYMAMLKAQEKGWS